MRDGHIPTDVPRSSQVGSGIAYPLDRTGIRQPGSMPVDATLTTMQPYPTVLRRAGNPIHHICANEIPPGRVDIRLTQRPYIYAASQSRSVHE
jgi:hypothetical protein